VFLQRSAPHRPLTPNTVSKLIARRMRQADIRASGHQLRHYSASGTITE
jgi:integrase